MSNIIKALTLASAAHGTQKYGSFPYIYHLHRTLEVAQELGCSEDIQVACVLHDVLEDTALSYNDLKGSFGEKVAEMVYDVTDELGKNRTERHERTYHKTGRNRDAVMVKLCDKIANVRESNKTDSSKMLKLHRKEQQLFKDTVVFHWLDNIDIYTALKVLEGELG